MSVNAIGGGYENQTKLSTSTIGKEQENPGEAFQISKLNNVY